MQTEKWLDAYTALLELGFNHDVAMKAAWWLIGNCHE
jgi:hypothetical protein